MKSETQEKFDRIIKNGFQEVLKPLGFKKKANNFYLQLENIGQIINIQKSKWSTKEEIEFTINTGIFVPEYWTVFYNYLDEEIPKFPTEPVCLIRERIGNLRNQQDLWFKLNKYTDEGTIIEEMKFNILNFIIPFFESINSRDKLIQQLETNNLITSPALSKLIIFGEFDKLEKAKEEYFNLLKKKGNPHFLANIKSYGSKYGLN